MTGLCLACNGLDRYGAGKVDMFYWAVRELRRLNGWCRRKTYVCRMFWKAQALCMFFSNAAV